MPKKPANPKALLFFILLSLAAGAIGSIFTFDAIPVWYTSLSKPSFTPPAWLFGPAWTALYVLMGVSAYRVWQKGMKNEQVRHALFLFTMQLVLNAAWPAAFFGLRSPLYGLIVIALLWLSIIAAIRAFYLIDKRAAHLLVPYILWVSFAAILNLSIWMLNP